MIEKGSKPEQIKSWNDFDKKDKHYIRHR